MTRWDLLDGLSGDDLRQVIASARRRTYARGEVVFHRGDPADTLHLIQTGRFAVRVATPVGQVATFAIHGPGDAFGEQALVVRGGHRSATVSALEAGETHAIYVDDFNALRRAHPEVGEALIRLLAERVARLSDRLVETLYAPASTRVINCLRELAGDRPAGEPSTVAIPLTQDDLAGLAGTTRITVNRVLQREKARGAVILERGRITVDPVRLGPQRRLA